MDDAYFGTPLKSKDGWGTDKAKAVIALAKDGTNHPAYLRVEVIDTVSYQRNSTSCSSLCENEI